VFIFSSVWFLSKKITKPVFYWNQFKPIGFGYFRTKTGSNRLGSVFSAWLGFFSGLTRVFSVWVRFGFFDLSSVWFFRFQTYKTETEPVGFFKILIGFFQGSVFSVILFYFISLIDFLIFLLTLRYKYA